MQKTFNWQGIVLLVGIFLCIETAFMIIAALIAVGYGEYEAPYFLYSAGITLAIGIGSILIGKHYRKNMEKKEGFVTITFTWISLSLFGMLPYVWSGAIPSFTDAFFESMSGFTTTGASVLTNIDQLPHGILFWRSLTQWVGGMGFVVLSMAILPFLGGNLQLFSAEATGPTHEKMQPRIKKTARMLWILYFLLTLAQTLLLRVGGMEWFDAICNSFTTIATGGYATKQASIGYWNSPFIQYIFIIFMIVGGTSFLLIYLSIIKGQYKRLFHDDEFRTYILLIIGATLLIGLFVSIGDMPRNSVEFERRFREVLFQVVSFVTTSGFVTCDYTLWNNSAWLFLLLLMFMGACSGSTCGGMKLSRVIILIKNGYFEFRHRVHPNAYLPVKLNGHVISERVVNSIYAFFIVFISIMLISTMVFVTMGLPIEEAMGASLSAIANIGPGLGQFGPTGSFLQMPDMAKWFMSFLMLVGRLEMFNVLMLLSPTFWKK